MHPSPHQFIALLNFSTSSICQNHTSNNDVHLRSRVTFSSCSSCSWKRSWLDTRLKPPGRDNQILALFSAHGDDVWECVTSRLSWLMRLRRGCGILIWKCSVVTFSMASFQKQLLCWIRIAALRQLWPAADLLSLVNRSPCAPRSEAPRLFTRAKSRFPAEHIFQNLATCICWAPALGGD